MANSKSHHSPKKGSTKPRKSPGTGNIGLAYDKPSTALTVPEDPEKALQEKIAEANIDTGVPEEKKPEEQWWYRKPDSKARKLAEKIAIARAAGASDKDIAKRLKTTEQTVRQTAYLARKNGWWDEQDEPVDVEADLAFNIDRKIIRNTNAILDGQMTNWQTFELTKEGLKGRGMFKQHEKSENTQQLSVVAIQVVMPPIGEGDQKPLEISDQNVGGVPAYLEDVIDGEFNATGSTDLVRVGDQAGG